jgi:hypothetical protein
MSDASYTYRSYDAAGPRPEEREETMSSGPRPFGFTAAELKRAFGDELEKRRERRNLMTAAAKPENIAEELKAFQETVLQVMLDNNRRITEQLLAAGVINTSHLPTD